ncbi:MAG: hypothetical protein IT379_40200 [Deltaproteobacteria bacterium]|nr:hypothetical protein [Deltaproteobacteria bacterium]
MPGRARSLANAALVSGPLVALLGPIAVRYATLRVFAAELGPRVWELPWWVLVLGTPESVVLQLDAPASGSVLAPSGIAPMLSIDPIWIDGAGPLIAGLGQVVAAIVARALARTDEARSTVVLVGGSLVGLVLAWPLTPSRALTMWLAWACPVALLTMLVWAIAALRSRGRVATPAPTHAPPP